MAQTEAPQDAIPKSHTAASGEYDKKCIFCKVVNKEMGTELLHCVESPQPAFLNGDVIAWNVLDEEICCFKDIRPAVPHHYLVVPTKHVGNCKSLTKEHLPLVKRMVELGKEILEKNNVTDLSDVRFGFHWPPFCSVTHLHLHVMAPVSQMGFMSRLMYKLNSYWFITADQLMEILNSKAEAN